MSNDMKLIMENWRLSEEKLLKEASAMDILNTMDQAEEKLKGIQDARAKKKALAGLFVGVSSVALAISLAGPIALALKFYGIKMGATSIMAKIGKMGFAQFWETLPDEPHKAAIMDKLPDIKGKVGDMAKDAIEKLLNMPDEKAAKSEFLRAIDVPDGLEDMLDKGVYDEVITKVKDKVYKLAMSGGDVDSTTMQLASKMLRHKFQLDIIDPRVKMNQ